MTPPAPRPALSPFAHAGFTLVELVVAMAIAAALLATVPVAFGRAHATMEYRATLRGLLSGLKEARLLSARSGRAVDFVVDLSAHRYGVGRRLAAGIPADLAVSAVVAEREVRGGRAAIRFYPDGGATGGSIVLLRPSGDGARLRVDWLLGRVSVESLGT